AGTARPARWRWPGCGACAPGPSRHGSKTKSDGWSVAAGSWSLRFSAREIAGVCSGHNLEALRKELALVAGLALNRIRELESRHDGDLNELCLEKLPQLVTGPAQGDDFRAAFDFRGVVHTE